MLGKKSLLGGFIGLFFFAIIVFFIIYFLTPEVSIRFFGITFRPEAYIESSLEDAMTAAGVSRADAERIVKEDGPELLSVLMEKSGESLGRIVSYLSSEDGQAMIAEGADYIRSGAGSLVDYLSSQEDFT